jgi:deoxyribodipyrimidine photolyase-related protein
VKVFRDKLDAARPRVDEKRSWIFVPYDQLTDRLGPLARIEPDRLGLVLVESLWKPRRRPYHKQKLALILANQRQFALEQARRGVAIRYVATAADYASALRTVAGELGPLTVMRPAERELRKLLEPLVADGLLEEIPHEGWLTTPDDFAAAGPESGPWRMDAFYRAVRRRTGILMDGAKPVGGKFSFDAENRLFWDGEPPAPEPPRFEPDDVTREAAVWVESRFSDHPGAVDLSALPATAGDAERLRSWAREWCLPSFGPYEDAMSTASGGLFHTRLSPLLNIHRVLPSDVLDDALRSEVPLASREGFVRQVVGWREFVRHVSEATDGFRDLPGSGVAASPGAAGWERVSAWRAESSPGVDGGATPNALDASRSLPAAYWGQASGLGCLDHVVRQVMDEGWTHHIPRLMVLSNLATLLSIRPRDITDWFWVAFVDAFDWVVEPNVLAMGTFATGPIMTTKPYVSGAAYIDRMGDFCHACAFDPKRDCPITHLYWAFLARNEGRLADNPRMRIPLSGLRRRSEERQVRDREVFDLVWKALEEGRALAPADLA